MTALLEAADPRALDPTPGARVAVVDDVDDAAEATSELLMDAGFVPIRIDLVSDVAALVDDIVAQGRAAVCDHRLDRFHGARYDGAQVAALVHQRGLPSVVLTTFASIDGSRSIRRWRDQIPVVLHRGRGDSPDELREALHQSSRELAGKFAEDRQAHRTVIRVEQVEDLDLALVYVSAWNPYEAVQVPAMMVSDATGIPIDQLPGRRFLADVNIRAEDADDLYFRDITLAPDLPPTWMPARAGA